MSASNHTTTLFGSVAVNLEMTLRDLNPWWAGERLYNLPAMRRWVFDSIKSRLCGGLAPTVVLRGPRQVGKTTLLNQIITSLLDDGVDPKRILKVQFDDLPSLRKIEEPIVEIARWYRDAILCSSFHEATRNGEPVFLFFDEVQNLPDWATQVKHLVDTQPVRVMLTGSSALRIEAGRDSLAGRISTLDMGPLFLREIGELRGFGGLDPYLPVNGLLPLKDKAFWRDLRSFGERHAGFRSETFNAFSELGAYPVAQVHPDAPWEQVADQLVETVIRRAIQHDLRMGPKGKKRDENLLGEVFRLACRYIGQSPKVALYQTEIQAALQAGVGPQRIAAYLRFLDGTLLLRLIEPLELRLKKKKGAPKITLCDHMLRAAWLREKIPLAPEALSAAPHLSDMAGRIAESALGYFLGSVGGLDIAHFPERPREPEVDFVITVGDQRIPIEVKYRRTINHQDTIGLRSFIEKAHYNAPFGLLVTLLDEAATDDPRIVSLPLSTLLLMR